MPQIFKYDAIQSSIFFLMHLAYDWPILRLADVYGVPQSLFVLWLTDMGFDQDAVKHLDERKPFALPRCKFCGMLTEDRAYCSNDCYTARIKNRIELLEVVKTRKIPLTIYKNTYYDVRNDEVIRTHDNYK